MKSLRYFLGGVISVLFLLPILNKLSDVIFLWIETLKIRPAKKILNYQKDITVINEFIKQPEESYDYEIEYSDDDD
jgi:hypothetical protein